MRFKGLGALGLSAIAIGLLPGVALAAKPGAATGAAANVTFSSARVNGSVDPNREAANFYFQYGTTVAFGTETGMVPVGAGANPVRVSVDLGGLAANQRYYYRIVAQNASGTTLGQRRSFVTRRQGLGITLLAAPNPIKLGSGTTVGGVLTGTGNAGRRIVLQSNPWPYTQGFQNAANEQVTSATGGFSFPVVSVPFNTQYRAILPDRPQIVSPVVTAGVKFYVKTRVSDRRVRRGKLVRFAGSVQPARPGAQIAFQKQSGRTWRTVGGTIVKSGGKYAKRVRIRRSGTYRVWTGVTNAEFTSNYGPRIKIRATR